MPTCHLLYVEDAPDDRFLFQAICQCCFPHWVLHTVSDGHQAIDYLSGVGQYRERRSFPMPDVVLMDLNLKSMSGFDLLAWLRAQPCFAQLPVLVLSGSANEQDERCARELGATGYFKKTPMYSDVLACVSRLLASTQEPGFIPNRMPPSPGDSPTSAWIF